MRYRYEISIKADSVEQADEVIARMRFANPEMGSLAERVAVELDCPCLPGWPPNPLCTEH